MKPRKETLSRLSFLEGKIHQDVVEIDLRCDKILPQFWIIQFTNKIVQSVLECLNRNPGVTVFVAYMPTIVLQYYCHRENQQKFAAWEKRDTANSAIGTARPEDKMDGLY